MVDPAPTLEGYFAQTVFQALVYEIGGWSAVGIALGAMIVPGSGSKPSITSSITDKYA